MKEMKMDRSDLEIILRLRQELIESHFKCRDYKSNKNAIMRELDHVKLLESSIRQIDSFIKKYVEFG